MKTKLNHKSGVRQSGQVLAWFVLTFLALSSSVGPRAQAQSGGPGADAGVVKSIDDGILEIRSGSHTTQYIETDSTKWLDQNGRRIDAGDTVGKMVEVRFRWVTGGSEAMSVQISGSSRSAAAEESWERRSREKSNDFGEAWGTVESIDDAVLELRNSPSTTLTFTETDETQWLNKHGKRIEAGDVVGKRVWVRFRPIGDGRVALVVQIK